MYDKNSNIVPLTKEGMFLKDWNKASFLYRGNWGFDVPDEEVEDKRLGIDPDSESVYRLYADK